MASREITFTISRWFILRTLPGAWFHGVRALGHSPWRPFAIWCLLRMAVAVALGRRIP
jgi:hypothetical protein